MPRETVYAPLYSGAYVTLEVAEPEAVLISKAIKAPGKNRALITEYLARGASARFIELATRYNLELESFL